MFHAVDGKNLIVRVPQSSSFLVDDDDDDDDDDDGKDQQENNTTVDFSKLDPLNPNGYM